MVDLKPNRNKNVLLVLLVLALALKFFIDVFVEIDRMDVVITGVSMHKNIGVYINCDDIEMSSVARYVILGKGFVTDVSAERPKYRIDTLWPSAYRPTLNVLVHVAGLKMYAALHPEYDIRSDHNIPVSYFRDFAICIFIVKNILFVISLFYFFSLARLFLGETAALASTLLYCVYPSVILYVGMINIYESIITPTLVIIMSIHLYNRRFNREFGLWEIAFFTLSIPLISFLKLQACLIMICYYAVAFFDAMLNRRLFMRYLKAYTGATLFIGIFVAYIFSSHYKSLGHAVVSTQASLNLFQGHSQFARGGWNPLVFKQHQAELQPAVDRDINMLSGSEYDETQVYKSWAMDWIKANPLAELKLCIRKAAILFSPHNSNCLRNNVVTLIVHLLFFGFVISLLLNRFHGAEYFYLLSPIVAIFAVSLIYYVEYRWRFMADPFIVLLACIFLNDLSVRLQDRRAVSK